MKGIDIKKKIEAAGFSANMLAADLKISHQVMYGRLSSNDVKVSFLLDLCRVTGLSLSYFLDSYIDCNTDDLKKEISEKDKIIVNLTIENNRLKNKIYELEKQI